jgi:hypothetical protein
MKNKVVVIYKPDKTIHQAPSGNLGLLMKHNHLLPESEKWVIEEMEEEEAKKLPFINDKYVSVTDAKDKIKEQNSLIKELTAKLEVAEAAAKKSDAAKLEAAKKSDAAK